MDDCGTHGCFHLHDRHRHLWTEKRKILLVCRFPTVKLHELQQAQWNGIDITFTQSAETPVPAFQIWLAPDQASIAWQKLIAARGTPAGSEAFEKFRVLCGIPEYGKDIREKELPQETMQEHALNFNKGCYVGQEIVERIHSRGICAPRAHWLHP